MANRTPDTSLTSANVADVEKQAKADADKAAADKKAADDKAAADKVAADKAAAEQAAAEKAAADKAAAEAAAQPKLIRMVRAKEASPEGPYEAEVHPDEVDGYKAHDWSVA